MQEFFASYLNGKIDETKIYRYALNADEVKVEFNRGSATVLGSLYNEADGTVRNNFGKSYCPPGNEEGSCATGSSTPPAGHWTFDERSGTIANDIGINGLTGTLTNGPVWTTGKIGQALKLDGVNDYVDMGDPASGLLDFGTGSFSYSAWFKASPNNTNTSLISKKQDGAAGSVGYMIAFDPPWFAAYLSDGIDQTASLISLSSVTEAWHHAAVVEDRGTNTQYFYLDGVLKDSDSISAVDTISSAEKFIVGAYAGGAGGPMDGTVDDIRIYNYARTPAQIAWDYNRGGPVGHWKLDECTGTTASDSSGKGNNGTITIGATGSNTSAGNCSTVDTTTAWYNGRNGKYNSSLSIDSTDDRVDMGDPSSGILDFAGDFSWGAWIKTTATDSRAFMEKWNGNGTAFAWYGGINFNSATNKANCAIYLNGPQIFADSTTSVNDGNWHHILCVRSGSTLYIYVDGKQEGSTTGVSGDVSNAVTFDIGGWNSGGSGFTFNGQIDDVRIYNYALTATQIRTLYNENSAIRFGPAAGSP